MWTIPTLISNPVFNLFISQNILFQINPNILQCSLHFQMKIIYYSISVCACVCTHMYVHMLAFMLFQSYIRSQDSSLVSDLFGILQWNLGHQTVPSAFTLHVISVALSYSCQKVLSILSFLYLFLVFVPSNKSRPFNIYLMLITSWNPWL